MYNLFEINFLIYFYLILFLLDDTSLYIFIDTFICFPRTNNIFYQKITSGLAMLIKENYQ